MSLARCYSNKYLLNQKLDDNIFKNKIIKSKNKDMLHKKQENENLKVSKIKNQDLYKKNNKEEVDNNPLFILKIALKDKSIRLLKYYKGDNIRQVAKKFCEDNSCDNLLYMKIISDIENNLSNINKNNNDDKKSKYSNYNNKNILENKINIGDKLYYKGIKKRENSYNNLIKKSINLKENQYKPLINSKTSKLLNKKVKVEDNLIKSLVKKQNKIDKLRQEKENKFKTLYTFNPKINTVSKEIINKKNELSSNSIKNNIFEELYQKKEFMDKRKNEIQNYYHKLECPFEPQIKKSYDINRFESENFNNRMEKYKAEKERKIEEIKRNDMFDPETKKGLFQPIIYRNGRERERPYQHKQVHNYLYSLNNLIIKKNEEENENEYKLKKELTQVKKISNKSDKIIKEKINEKIEELFNYIDTNQDGEINKNDLKKDLFDPNILELFAPLFDEIINRGLVLNLESFKQSCENLFETYNIPIKNNILLNFGRLRSKKEHKNEDYPFKPNSKNEKKINRKYRNNIPIHDYLYNIRNNHEIFIKEQKNELEKKELVECTFQPNINK